MRSNVSKDKTDEQFKELICDRRPTICRNTTISSVIPTYCNEERETRITSHEYVRRAAVQEQ